MQSIEKQTIHPSIITVVDNESTDTTVSRARYCQKTLDIPIKIESYANKNGIYRPGHCLNQYGMKSKEEFIVILSAHCIPSNESWLKSLFDAVNNKKYVAAAYGRQVPTSKSDARDARDLLWTFGNEKKEQTKDIFFHNANSIIRKSVLEKIPFDEEVRNIEDRVWAKKVLEERKFKIIYEPKSIVFHEHGIHQSGKVKRAESIVRIARQYTDKEDYEKIKRNLTIVIPYKTSGDIQTDETLLRKTIEQVSDIQQEGEKTGLVISLCAIDDEFKRLKQINKEVTWVKRQREDAESASMQEILLNTIDLAAKKDIYIEHLLVLEPKYINRSKITVRKLIEKFYSSSSEIVMTQLNLKPHIWKESKGKMIRIDTNELGRNLQEKIVVSLRGLGLITSIENLRNEYWLDRGVDFIECDSIEAIIHE